ncbi:hypothetical protein M9435_006992 [Picochlorum sp. BPE23]|nr:hypothetical protein M9435_006992 [Picochlorum sp. BPE23]
MQQVITRGTDSIRASCSNHPDVSRFKVKIPNYAERDKESAFGHPSRYRFSKEAEIISPGDSLPGGSLGWAFDSEEEARSFTTYMATDLFNRMGNLCKCTSVLSPETFRLIPKIPWDRTWTNDEITRFTFYCDHVIH